MNDSEELEFGNSPRKSNPHRMEKLGRHFEIGRQIFQPKAATHETMNLECVDDLHFKRQQVWGRGWAYLLLDVMSTCERPNMPLGMMQPLSSHCSVVA